MRGDRANITNGLGFLGPEGGLIDQLALEKDARSNIKADYEDYHTSLEGVFAAGDARRGQSFVLTKVAGRQVSVTVT